MTLQEKAAKARSYFTMKTRDNGKEFWLRKDDAPQWVDDLCRAAHSGGQMFPNDYRYEFIVDALDAFEQWDDPDEITLEPDVYNHDLLQWLSSLLDRAGYCNEVMEEYGADAFGKDIMKIIMAGQVREKEEVLSQVRGFLEGLELEP